MNAYLKLCLVSVFVLSFLTACALGPPADDAAAGTSLAKKQRPKPVATIYLVQVMTGDAIIIDVGDHEAIIDGGGADKSLAKFIRKNNIVNDDKIELVVLTHGDSDHVDGLDHLLFKRSDDKAKWKYQVGEFWTPGWKIVPTNDPDLKDSCDVSEEYRTLLRRAKQLVPAPHYRDKLEDDHTPATAPPASKPRNVTFNPINNTHIQLLHSSSQPHSDNMRDKPPSGRCAYLKNNTSVVMRLEFEFPTTRPAPTPAAGAPASCNPTNRVSILLTGDVNGKLKNSETTIDVEALLLANVIKPCLQSTLLKVSHHGSNTASTADFIAAVAPQAALISGWKLVPGLPHPKTLKRLKSYFGGDKSKLFRTGRRGTIMCNVYSPGVTDDYVECKYKRDWDREARSP